MLLIAFPENMQQRMVQAREKKKPKPASHWPSLDRFIHRKEICILMAAGEKAVPGTRGTSCTSHKAPAEMLQEGTREQQQQLGQAGTGSEGEK